MVFREVTPDGTTKLTGGAPVVPETLSGMALQPSSPINSTSTAQVVLLTIPIPKAGKWVISFNARGSIAGASQYGIFALYNGSGVLVPNSTSLSIMSGAAGTQGSPSRTMVVTTTGAETFTVKAWSGGAWTVNWYSNVDGYAVATWYELAGSVGPAGPAGDVGGIGPAGPTGPAGPQGTRWGNTTTFVLGTAANAPVSFPDGLPPRVGDFVVSSNALAPGLVNYVTAVVDATHANLSSSPSLNIRGPQGATGPQGNGLTPIRRVYTANGTWTKPAGLLYIDVEVQGGGGAGGGAGAIAASGQHAKGGGGGAGGLTKKRYQASDVGATETIVVGAGGTTVSGGTGNTGGTSSFGTTAGVKIDATGGVGGTGQTTNPASFSTTGGPGGSTTTSVQDLLIGGTSGEWGWGDANLAASGRGGDTQYGPGGITRTANSANISLAGVAGTGYGSGGGGAVTSGATAAAQPGGVGGAGVVIVTEYYSGSSPGPAGPAGAPGPAGPEGPTGPMGTVSLLQVYPIGAIYMSAVNTDPGTLFGGTWVSWGAGRVAVGVNPADTDFDTSEETGGKKAMTAADIPAHSHTINHDHGAVSSSSDTHTHAMTAVFWETTTSGSSGVWRVADINNEVGATGTDRALNVPSDTHAHTVDLPAYAGSSGNNAEVANPTNNMPPYITCYMWKRTA